MKIKKIYSLVFALLLFCSVCAPAALAQDTSAIVLNRFDEPSRADAVAFAVGTSQEELTSWFANYSGGFTGYDAQGNAYDLMTGTWSLNTIDTGTPGVYFASAVPDLGEGYTLAEGVSLPRQLCAVSIQTTGEPDINCCVSARGFLHFPWVLSPEQQNQLEQFTVLLRQDGGEWAQLSEGFCFTSDDFQLSQRILTYGSTYELKVTYPGGQTGILTFTYDDELTVVDYSGGDRDGGDANGSGPLTGTQPAPSSSKAPDSSSSTPGKSPTESSPASSEPSSAAPTVSAAESAVTASDAESQGTSSERGSTRVTQHYVAKIGNIPPRAGTASQETSSAVQESYSPTQTVISGLRLRDLCAGEKSVVFGSGDLTVSISSEQLLALKLKDTDTLSVTLTQPEKNKIALAVNVSGSAITELPGTVLRLRYKPQSENAVITIQDNEGNPLADTAFDGEFLRFTANASGTYTILEASKPKEAQKGVSPLLPVSGGLILAAGGITLFRRRRHG